MIQDLFERNQSVRLQSHIDNQMLLRLLDHLAGDNLVAVGFNDCGFRGLLALKSLQGGRKVHRLHGDLGGRGSLHGFRSRRGRFRCNGGFRLLGLGWRSRFSRSGGHGFSCDCGLGGCGNFRCNRCWRGFWRGFHHGYGLGLRLGWGIRIPRW